MLFRSRTYIFSIGLMSDGIESSKIYSCTNIVQYQRESNVYNLSSSLELRLSSIQFHILSNFNFSSYFTPLLMIKELFILLKNWLILSTQHYRSCFITENAELRVISTRVAAMAWHREDMVTPYIFTEF